MSRVIISAIIMFVSGCAVTPEYFDGESVTYNHGTARFNDAMADAAKQCASVGKLVKHESTDCPNRCISTFACNEKKSQ
jgi:hypothetical protein